MRLDIRELHGIKYVYYAENYRDPVTKQPKYRIVQNFGRLDDLLNQDANALQKLKDNLVKIEEEKEKLKYSEMDKQLKALSQSIDTAGNSKDSVKLMNYGICIYRQIWNRLNLTYKFTQIQRSTKSKYNFNSVVFLLTALRCLKPDSKLATFGNREKFIADFSEIQLQDIYKILKVLDENKNEIEKYVSKRIKSVYGREAYVAFYDVTTFAFESTIADEQKNFGYSKDKKFNEVQVVMGMVMDSNGIPIHYGLYSGNTSEFSTLEPVLNELKKEFGFQKIYIVADRGLNSGKNLKAIKEKGYEFIMAYKLRSGTSELKEKILSSEGYNNRYDEETGEVIGKQKAINFEARTGRKKTDPTISTILVIDYSEKRKRKDEADRERLIKKAERFVDRPSLFSSELKKGGKSLLKISYEDDKNVKFDLTLDKDKIEEQCKYDGYYGVISSDTSLDTEKIMSTHKELLTIEDDFKIEKSWLEARPCFVWTPTSIRGHFVICYLALTLQRCLELTLRNNNLNVSTYQLFNELRNAMMIEIDIKGNEIYCKSIESPLFDRISEVVGIGTLNKYNSKIDIERALHMKL